MDPKIRALLERARDCVELMKHDTPSSLESEGRKTTLERLLKDIETALKPEDEAPARRVIRIMNGREIEVG